jgi:hypothetical protein
MLGSISAGNVSAAPGRGETPRHYCARVGNDDTMQRPPLALARPIGRLFHLSGGHAIATTYYRCARGVVLVCNVGANLPCGKANTGRELPQAHEWCRSHPQSRTIPLSVAGHDTLYEWRCARGVAKPVRRVGRLDERGFFPRYWKALQSAAVKGRAR